MGKKVRVTTKCGETFEYDHDQEVKTVEIIEEENYQLQEKLKAAFKALDNTCPGATCDKCAFKVSSGDCAHVNAREELKRAQGYDGE